jgi:hypothetical protein
MSRFFLSAARLRVHQACPGGMNQWTRKYGEAEVLVTQEVVDYIAKCEKLSWVINRMKLSPSQRRRLEPANDAFWRTANGSREEKVALRELRALQKQLILEGPGGDA